MFDHFLYAAGQDRRPLSRPFALMLLLGSTLALGSSLLGTATHAFGASFTLSRDDNGSTTTVAPGDRITLRLGDDYVWNVTVSDYNVLRPVPTGFNRGEQGAWTAGAGGQATISATGRVNCRPGELCPAIAIAFSATIVVTSSNTPPIPPLPGAVTYPRGWNLVGDPSGTTLPVDAFSWNAAAGRYDFVAAGSPLSGGHGYWAFFRQASNVSLAGGSPFVQVSAPALTWVQIGNPSAVATVFVTGADLIYVWNPSSNSYSAVSTLPPGQGAWALSFGGSVLTIAAQ